MNEKPLQGERFQTMPGASALGRNEVTWRAASNAANNVKLLTPRLEAAGVIYSAERVDGVDVVTISGTENLEKLARAGGSFNGSIHYEDLSHLAVRR